VAVVQRSGESTAAQELCAAEQGGRRELGFGAATAMGMRRRGAAMRLKDVAGVLGMRTTNGRSARIAGLTPRAREADRDVALRDPGLWAKLLEGRGAERGWSVGLRGLGWSTGQRGRDAEGR
jgi:hypothetical protein